MIRALLVLGLCSGCGIVFGADAIEKTAVATHDGEGIEHLIVDTSVEKGIRIRGGADQFVARMTTIEWRAPDAPEPPARSLVEFIEVDRALELSTRGGGEAVTLRQLELDAIATADLTAIVGGDDLTVSGFDSDVLLEADGTIRAEAMRGALTVRGKGKEIDVEVDGFVDIDATGPITARMTGEGVITTENEVDIELTAPLSGPLDIQLGGEVVHPVSLRIRPGDGATLELDSGTGNIDVLVGETDLAVTEEYETIVVEVGGGGPRVFISATGSITISELDDESLGGLD